jgi:hypothetical protein
VVADISMEGAWSASWWVGVVSSSAASIIPVCVCVCVCMYVFFEIWEGRRRSNLVRIWRAREGLNFGVCVCVPVCVYLFVCEQAGRWRGGLGEGGRRKRRWWDLWCVCVYGFDIL